MTAFRDELQHLINKHGRENESGTPDFILAKYLDHCLTAYGDAIEARDQWYGWTANVGGVSTLERPAAMTEIAETPIPGRLA